MLVADHKFEINDRDFQISVFGWFVFMLAVTLYCILHHIYVSSTPVDITSALLWVVREWGIWGLLSPVIFTIHTFVFTRTKYWYSFYIPLILTTFSISLSYQTAMAVYFSHGNVLANFVTHIPKFLFSFSVISIYWHYSHKKNASTKQKESVKGLTSYTEKLLVYKGNDQCIIAICDIESVSAAGNYVEIQCNGEQYLLRSTLKGIEEQLPPHQFTRTHRSHIVNISAIERIKTLNSGCGLIKLHNGQELNLSKRYKQHLKGITQSVA